MSNQLGEMKLMDDGELNGLEMDVSAWDESGVKEKPCSLCIRKMLLLIKHLRAQNAIIHDLLEDKGMPSLNAIKEQERQTGREVESVDWVNTLLKINNEARKQGPTHSAIGIEFHDLVMDHVRSAERINAKAKRESET